MDLLNSLEDDFNIKINRKILFNRFDAREYTTMKYLGEIADFTLGITPYDKYKGHSQELIKSRGFHSDTKDSDAYKPLISGGNIERYFISDEIKEYIKYGDWLGAPRDERFFNSPNSNFSFFPINPFPSLHP